MRIDITGNWIWQEAPQRGLIVSQPEPPKNGNCFRQTLMLPAGTYMLHLVYRSNLDHDKGKAVFNFYDRFTIIVNGKSEDVAFVQQDDSSEYRAKLRIRHNGGLLTLVVWVKDTCCFNQTVLEGDGMLSDSAFYALPPEEPGREPLLWSMYRNIPNSDNILTDVTVVRGIPFQAIHCSEPIQSWGGWRWLEQPEPRWQIADWKKGSRDCGDIPVDTMYCLGMTHCYDISNGSWYSDVGDYSLHHFIGDRLGTLELVFADGTVENVPLVLGWNVWYGMPWDFVWIHRYDWEGDPDIRAQDDQFFGGNTADRQTVQECVGLDDGIRRMGEENNERFLFTLRLDGRRLRSVRVLPAEDKSGQVTISAITLRTTGVGETFSSLTPLPCFGEDTETDECRLTVHTLAEVREEAWLPAVERLQHVFYTFTDELPQLTEPQIPEGYIGPRYDFSGSSDAVLTSTYLYKNGPNCAAYIADEGMGCCSPTARWCTTFYMNGFGLVQPTKPWYDGTEDFLRKYAEREAGEFPGVRSPWSRGVGELLRETMALGYDKCIRNYVRWMDDHLFSSANPPHWTRQIGLKAGDYSERMVGETEERGNRENDGHGICMWSRYMMWLWMDRDAAWNEERWEATRAACDWIRWQLDTDTIFPGERKDILYTESECAHSSYDTYSSGNCLHGLELSIRMAEQLGKTEEVTAWKALYNRLAQGMLDHLREENEEYGTLWYTSDGCDWQDHAHKMVHLQLAPDGNTYTPLEDYTDGFHREMLEADINSYRYVMRRGDYNFLRMYGYGQGMVLQSALLLDRMDDAAHLLHKLVTHCYLPRMEGFLAPEGIIMHPSDRFYLPVNGYTGQDAHIADSVKAVRLQLGVDDNRPGLLRLVPRFPAAWGHCAIAEYPVLTNEGRGTLQYVLDRTEQTWRMEIAVSAPVQMELRAGPFTACPGDTVQVRVNGTVREAEPFFSGDSWWIWIRSLTGKDFAVEIE